MVKKKFYLSLFVTILMLLCNCLNSYAAGPVMVLRFNQENVYFEKPLERIVNKAIDLKPNARFKIVSLVKKIGIEENDQIEKEIAIANVERVEDELFKNNISKANIEIVYQNVKDVRYNEIHLYIE